MKKVDIRNNENFKKLGNYYSIINITLFVFQINLLLSMFLFKKSFLVLPITTFCLLTISVLVLKDVAPDNQKKLSFNLFKSSFLIFALSLVNHLIVSGLGNIQNDKIVGKLTTMMYLINIGIMISSIAFYTNEKVVEFFNTLYENSFLEAILGKEDEIIKSGDAIIGKDIKTGKPVILPHKDRYLHCLILGPTGSGKTSQSIIPMINRDMQWNKLGHVDEKWDKAGIIVIEPKGDLAEKVYAMAKHYDREVMYFNPILPDCPYFNPLFGDESDVIENMATTFKMFSEGSSQFFLDMNENLVRKALKVLKRVKGNDATLIDLSNVINGFKEGQELLAKFSRLGGTPEIITENKEIYEWFKTDYYSSLNSGGKGGTKTYEHCSAIRSQVAKLISNKYLRKVLNPPEGKNDIDFDKMLEEGTVLTIATAQGKLRDLGRFLGYFIILQLQSSVFRRKGNEDTRRPCFLYIDEFQVYANPGFADMLTQGRSYRVSSNLATQARDQIATGPDGKNFLSLVSTNARNLIIYPGGNAMDAEYYSKEFGEIIEMTERRGISKDKFTLANIGKGHGPVKESIQYAEETKARFSATDIKFREFGEITYCLIKNNSIQPPGVSKIEYIPKELNAKLDKMVEEYNKLQESKDPDYKKAHEESVKEDIFDGAIIKDIGESDKTINSETIPDIMSDIEDDFINDGDISAKEKNGPVISQYDYRVGNDIILEEEEDDLM